ncbi:hypothetical protein CA54_35780 [Symmachiella macrocystis]|uniref:Alginate export domain-containing protein n=1 Tax=Symmachiella macrocystis TaxID=2527985 RepID=A0A5C6BVL2_9PLAN|nr:hypothetical protein [Symmachiella macrocystis]TWU14709.1 hypothetical protein CA54_35780 [Symmachiella macrocystis]
MRMQHWSKWVMALLVNAACVATVHAQDYPVDVTDQSGVNQPQAGTGTGTVDATQMGTPMGAGQFTGYSGEYGSDPVQPWPEVSPFDNSFDQTYYDEGLWYRRTNRRQTRHYFNMDFWAAKLKRPKSGQPDGLVGSTIVNQDNVYEWTIREVLGQPQFVPEKDFSNNFYTQEFGADATRASFRTQFGAVNADDSGWEISAFFAPSDSDKDQNVTVGPTGLNRTPDFGASVGEGLATFNGGFVVTEVFPDLGSLSFDQGVIMHFDSKAWGGDINYYTTPIGNGHGNSDFHASMGIRYLGIWEDFGFQGSDSGFNERLIWVPDGRVYQISPFTTEVQSKLKSNLVGPQLGLKWALGGDSFKLTTEAKGSIAANFEENELRYTGYGLQPNNDLIAADNPLNGFPNSNLRPGDPRAGRENEVNVDYAPIFEVSVMAEFGFMQYVPVLNKLPGFGDSKFRFGYAYTQAWRIRRAAQAVNYNAPFPILNEDRENWHVGGWTAGFNWNF